MKNISTAIPIFLISSMVMANGLDNSVSGSYFEGEYQNDTNHTLQKIEARGSFIDLNEDSSIYVIGSYEDYSHPVLDYNEWIGVGVQHKGFNVEAHSDTDHYRLSGRYTGQIDNIVITTALIHSDKIEGGFSQTSLNSGVGYKIEGVTVMAEYTVGNVTMRNVNDWYGLTIRWELNN